MKKTFLSILLVLAIICTCGFACSPEKVGYTVEISNDKTCGKVTGVNAAALYESGTELEITVTANYGYKISSIFWNGEEVEITNKGEMTFTKTVLSNCSLQVFYMEGYYTMNVVNDDSQGAVVGIKNGASYKYGEIFDVTVTPRTGYKISRILVNDQPITVTNEKGFSFQLTINGVTTVKITYAYCLKTITVVNDDAKGTVTGIENGGKHEEGAYKTIYVSPKEGFEIASVTWNGVAETLTDNQKKNGWSCQKQIVADCTLTVTYKATKAFLTIENDSSKGYVGGVPTGNVCDFGTSVTFNVVPLPGYAIKSITFNGTQKTLTKEQQNNGYSFTETINNDAKLSVVYEQAKSTASVTSDSSKGTVTGIENGKEYGLRETVTITITPRSGYAVKKATWNGTEIAFNDSEKIKGKTIQREIGETNTLVVEYEEQAVEKYTATVSASSAMVVVSGVSTVQDYYLENEKINLYVVAKEGYKLLSVTVNGTAVGITDEKSASYQITVSGNVSIVILAEGWSENV